MKAKALIPLVVGLAVGLIAIKYTMDTVKKAGADNTQYVQVVLAIADIPATVPIKPEMVKAVKSPRTPLLPPDVFTTTEDVIGRVTQKSIPQGAAVLPSMIAPKGTLPGIGVRVKKDFRAVTVKIDESSGVGYLVRPEDWVDVLVVMDIQKKGRRETISRVILQNIQVGAVGQALGDANKDDSGGRQAKSVTLIVKKDEVPKLHLAQSRGRITLAMRGSEDAQVGENAEATESEVLGEDNEDEKVAQADSGNQNSSTNFLNRQDPDPTPPPNREVSVTVVNGTASGGGKAQVKHVTFTDEKSMDVVEVRSGIGAGSKPTRNRVSNSPFYNRRRSDLDVDKDQKQDQVQQEDLNSDEVVE